MRPLLRLIVEAGGSISCGVYWNYTLRLTECRRALWWWDRGQGGEGAYRTLLAYNVSPCYDMLEQCIPVFVDTPGPVFGSESDRPTLWPFTPRLTSLTLLTGGMGAGLELDFLRLIFLRWMIKQGDWNVTESHTVCLYNCWLFDWLIFRRAMYLSTKQKVRVRGSL